MELQRGTPKEAGVSARRVSHVVSMARGWVEDGMTPALVVLAARKGVVFLHEAFGKLRPDPDSPAVSLDTIYPLASVSKPMTASALMCLVEDGLVGLNRPVADYIPEFAGGGREIITVRHILSHTSGMRDGDTAAHAEAQQAKLAIPPCPATAHPAIHEWFHLRVGAPVHEPPETQMVYFNFGFTLAGEIVRRVSGVSFPEFCRRRVWAPLGMKDTYFTVPERVQARVVRRPDGTPFDWWNGPQNMAWPGPAGGGYATAMDMAIFGQMFLNGGTYGGSRVLSRASVRAMTRAQGGGLRMDLPEDEDEPFPKCPYGLGWFIFGEDTSQVAGGLWSPRTFGHIGSGGVMLWVDPEHEIVGVFLFAQMTYTDWPGDLFSNAITAAVV